MPPGHEQAPDEPDLEELRDRLVALVDSSNDAIVSKTLDGVITSWNQGAERLFGWRRAEAIGRHISLIIPQARHAEEDEVLARIRRGETVNHYETVRVTRNGRRLEDERDRLLAREQQAREEAEASNRTKDHLLATVSHELRTPLNSILGWARLLESGGLEEASRSHAVSVIIRSGSSLAHLVDDLLDISRIVTGRMRLTLEECDVATLVEDALDAVRPAAEAKGLELGAALAPDVGRILGEPTRLRQVVWNLAMNAIKFTPTGGRVDVAVTRSARAATIVVTDNGVGIGPEVLPHVFEPFRQEDSSSTRAHGGLGLGLALVKHLVELHAGRVDAESPGKGQGATFTVTIPLVPLRSHHTDPRPRS